MDFSGLIPTPDPLPVPYGVFEALALPTFTIHLLFMNVLLGSTLFVFVEGVKRLYVPAAPGSLAHPAASVGLLPAMIAFTVNFGLPPLLFAQTLYGQFLYTANTLMAWTWVAVPWLVFLAYVAAYVMKFRLADSWGLRTVFAALMLPLLLAVSFIMSNHATLSLTPARWTLPDGSGAWLNWGEPTLIPRWFHFVNAAVAVAGLFHALYAKNRFRAGLLSGTEAQARVERGLAWTHRATVLQIGLGLWFFLSLPREVIVQFMGRSTLHTAGFAVAFLLALVVLWAGFGRRLRALSVLLPTVVLVMVGLRELVRIAYLKPVFHPADLPVTGQHGPLWMFLGVLVLVAAVMTRMLLRAAEVSHGEDVKRGIH